MPISSPISCYFQPKTHQPKEAQLKIKTMLKKFCKISMPALLVILTAFTVMKIPDLSAETISQHLLFGKLLSHETKADANLLKKTKPIQITHPSVFLISPTPVISHQHSVSSPITKKPDTSI